MNTIMKTLLEITLLSSVMIILVITIKAIWSDKINVKILSFLWLIVLTRLLMPITIESPLHFDSLLPDTIENTEPEQTVINPNNNAPANANNALFDFPEHTSYDTTSENDAQGTTPVITEPSLWEKSITHIKSKSLWSWAFIIWITGSIYLLLNSIYLGIKFSKKINRTAYTNNSDLNSLLNEAKICVNMHRQIPIFQSIHVDVPVVFGLFKPRIIIPTRLYLSATPAKLKLIILHELCHIKRKDMIINILWLLAKALHWFNPLVWIAYNMYLNDIELACDDMVISKVSKKDGFKYSQSLLDVVKLSKKRQRLPITLSFCNDKNKLRKRVMNMVKPQRKLKSVGFISILLAVIMIVACFTTACQPTPENVIDDEVQDAIPQADSSTIDVPHDDTLELIKLWTTDPITNTGGTITIMMNLDKTTFAKLESDPFTQEELDKMINVFFGDNPTFYDPLVTTKADIEASILVLQKMLNDEEAMLNCDYAVENEITDFEDITTHINELIENHKKRLAETPKEAPIIPALVIDEDLDDFQADVDFGEHYLGHISYDGHPSRPKILCYAFGDENESGRRLNIFTSTHVDANADDPELAIAKEVAQKLIDDMDIDGVQIKDVFISSDNVGNTFTGDVIISDREFYVFCFKLTTGDGAIAFTSYADVHWNSSQGPVPYEDFQVWVEGDRVVKFMWENPHKIA